MECGRLDELNLACAHTGKYRSASPQYINISCFDHIWQSPSARSFELSFREPT